MKKLFLLLLLLTGFIVLNAQNIRFGVTAGASIASAKGKTEGVSITSDSKVGFTGGVLVDIPLADQFAFQPGLNFLQKGSKFNINILGVQIDGKETLNYLELPLNFLFRTEAGSGKFFVGLGPVLGLGLSGKGEDKSTFNGQTIEEKYDVEFGTDVNTDHYKPFEFSGNVLAGYEFGNGIFIAVNYNLGISNIAVVDNTDNTTYRNRYFGIRLGYLFGGNANKSNGK
ncbi:MAG TPA: porin family protein [Chitinophagaceae bacterium]|nr:porin family protein [Chitinophagaceae bacterium]